MELEKRLEEWLTGIFEDDPLPDEVKFIYFVIVDEKVSYHLEIRGSEIKNTTYFEYYPLEAQYFFYDYPILKEDFIIQLSLALKNLPILEDRQVYIFSNGKLHDV